MWQSIWSHLLAQHTRDAEHSAAQPLILKLEFIYLCQLVKLHPVLYCGCKSNFYSRGA